MIMIEVDQSLLESMVDLVRDIASMEHDIRHPFAVVEIRQRAKAINEQLPKPMDPDTLAARDYLKSLPGYCGNGKIMEAIDAGEYDQNAHVVSFIAGLNAARK